VIIGMLSTRFGGLDGVSLEALKLADVLVEAGHEVVWFGGWLGADHRPGQETPSADLVGPENAALQARCFGRAAPDPAAERTIEQRAAALRAEIGRFVSDFSVDVLVPHNVLSLPLHLPLAKALVDLLETTGMPAVAHHHDFGWERDAYRVTSVQRTIERYFPPKLGNLQHMVINTLTGHELRQRTGLEADVVPNVMDFERGPEYAGDGARFRAANGLSDEDIVLLQPTRVIPRKGVESTIELGAAVADPAVKVVVTHPDDLDEAYWATLQALAGRLDIDLRLAAAGGSPESLADAYAAGDLVCFPSRVEGFGNALLEAFFYRRPVFVNRYPVYVADIAPTGVDCVEISAEPVPGAVARVRDWLADPATSAEAIEANYEAGRDHFSYRILRERFLPLVEEASRASTH